MTVDEDSTLAACLLVRGLGGPPIAQRVLLAMDVEVEIIALEILTPRGRRRTCNLEGIVHPGAVGDVVVEEGDPARPCSLFGLVRVFDSGSNRSLVYAHNSVRSDSLEGDGKVFDASQQPVPFPMQGGAIPGFLEGLKLMTKGSVYRLWLKPELAYGDHSPDPTKLPNGSLLVFDVTLVDFIPMDAYRQIMMQQMMRQQQSGAGAAPPGGSAPPPQQ